MEASSVSDLLLLAITSVKVSSICLKSSGFLVNTVLLFSETTNIMSRALSLKLSATLGFLRVWQTYYMICGKWSFNNLFFYSAILLIVSKTKDTISSSSF